MINMEFKTKEELSKFDKTRLIASRAHQIADGSPLKIDLSQEELEKINYNPIKIAMIELEKDLIDLKVFKEFKK